MTPQAKATNDLLLRISTNPLISELDINYIRAAFVLAQGLSAQKLPGFHSLPQSTRDQLDESLALASSVVAEWWDANA